MRFNTRSWATPLLLIAAVVSLAALTDAVPARAGAGAEPSSNIRDYIPSKLDDFTAIMHVTFHNDEALSKINKDFGMVYKLSGDVQMKYKEDNKFRLDGHVAASKATYVINGRTQWVKLSFGINTKNDLGAEPGKRKSLLDVGLVSGNYLGYANAAFKGVRNFEGTPCAMFELKYREFNLDSSHRFVWIDPRTKLVVKREEYMQEDSPGSAKLRATWFYRDPKEIAPGLWFPSRIEVRNAEGERAGEMVYKNMAVNVGLADSLFSL